MLRNTPDSHQMNIFGTDLLQQLDPREPLINLATRIPWQDFYENFKKHYKEKGAPAKPIRLMVGLLILKQLHNLSDENLVVAWKQNPYYQSFCGMTEFQLTEPCHSTELVKFRNRIGKESVEKIFQASIRIHGRYAQETVVNIDTTVQEKNITYPTDAKLAIKMINRLNKVAKKEGIKQRGTFGNKLRIGSIYEYLSLTGDMEFQTKDLKDGDKVSISLTAVVSFYCRNFKPIVEMRNV